MNLKTWIVATATLVLATSALGADSMQAKAAMQGNWQLEEWHSDGEILRSPQTEGRFSVRLSAGSYDVRAGAAEGTPVVEQVVEVRDRQDATLSLTLGGSR